MFSIAKPGDRDYKKLDITQLVLTEISEDTTLEKVKEIMKDTMFRVSSKLKIMEEK